MINHVVMLIETPLKLLLKTLIQIWVQSW